MRRGALRQVIVFLLGIGSIPAQASPVPEGTRCRNVAQTLMALLDSSSKIVADFDRASAFPYHGRFRHWFGSIDPKKFAKVFDPAQGGLSQGEFEQLFWMMKSGEVRVNPATEQFIVDVRWFVDDHGPLFWREDGMFLAMKQLEKADHGAFYDGAADATTRMFMNGVKRAEENVIARALGESVRGTKYKNKRWYDGFLNFWSPHFHRVSELMTFNNGLRKRMQLSLMADLPVDAALTEIGSALPAANLSALRGQITNTAADLEKSRNLARDVYGIEISKGSHVFEDEIRLREIHKRLQKIEIDNFEAEGLAGSEAQMDVIDEAYRVHRKADGQPEYRMADDVHDIHLQIRFPQYGRETDSLRSRYHSKTAAKIQNGDYDVDTEWTVTHNYSREVEHTGTRAKAGGEPGETETYTYTTTEYTSDTEHKSRIDTLQASYEEILDDRISPSTSEIPSLPSPGSPYKPGWDHSSSSNGSPSVSIRNSSETNRILARGKQLRAKENPFREKVAEVIARAESAIGKHPQSLKDAKIRADLTKDLHAARESLWKQMDEMDRHLKLSEGEVTKIYADDRLKDFRARNEVLRERIRHLAQRSDYLAAQISRAQASLEVAYQLPTYETELALLKKVYKRNRIIQYSGGSAVGALGGAYAYFHFRGDQKSEDDRVREWISTTESQTLQYPRERSELPVVPEEVERSPAQAGEREEPAQRSVNQRSGNSRRLPRAVQERKPAIGR